MLQKGRKYQDQTFQNKLNNVHTNLPGGQTERKLKFHIIAASDIALLINSLDLRKKN